MNESPVSVRLSSTNWIPYKSGVFNRYCSTKSDLHAALVVGYDESGNWIIKNSWGTRWGDKGYIKLAPNTNCIY